MKKKFWFFLILLIVVVAVVLSIILINVFRKKDTFALAENINEVTQNGYLKENDAKREKIEEYLDSLDDLTALADSKIQIENYKVALSAFETMGKFFNRQIVFTEFSSAYKKNVNEIKKNFQKAQKAVDKLADFIDATVLLAGESETWLDKTWADCQQDVETLYTSTKHAMKKLEVVYKASVPSKICNNDFTSLIFDGVDAWFAKIDEKTENAGEGLLNFVDAYMSKDAEKYILGYSYSVELQNEVADIAEKGEESAFFANFMNGQTTGGIV